MPPLRTNAQSKKRDPKWTPYNDDKHGEQITTQRRSQQCRQHDVRPAKNLEDILPRPGRRQRQTPDRDEDGLQSPNAPPDRAVANTTSNVESRQEESRNLDTNVQVGTRSTRRSQASLTRREEFVDEETKDESLDRAGSSRILSETTVANKQEKRSEGIEQTQSEFQQSSDQQAGVLVVPSLNQETYISNEIEETVEEGEVVAENTEASWTVHDGDELVPQTDDPKNPLTTPGEDEDSSFQHQQPQARSDFVHAGQLRGPTPEGPKPVTIKVAWTKKAESYNQGLPSKSTDQLVVNIALSKGYERVIIRSGPHFGRESGPFPSACFLSKTRESDGSKLKDDWWTVHFILEELPSGPEKLKVRAQDWFAQKNSSEPSTGTRNLKWVVHLL